MANSNVNREKIWNDQACQDHRRRKDESPSGTARPWARPSNVDRGQVGKNNDSTTLAHKRA
jgi:hypothetical protein